MNNFVILIPSYNDWDSLSVLIPKIHNVIKDLNKNISIIIINDGSTIKKKLIFKDKLCFNKIEILNLLFFFITTTPESRSLKVFSFKV